MIDPEDEKTEYQKKREYNEALAWHFVAGVLIGMAFAMIFL